MIRLSDVVKEYESGTTALKGISLRIEDGEFVFGRPERQRQVDDHQAAHRRDRADIRSDRRQRLQPDEHCRAADPAAAPLRRRHLPGLPPDREENGL